MPLTDEQIVEIVEQLDCGMVCFYHRPTGAVEFYPAPDNPYADLELWQDTIDKIENDPANYDTFEKMSSSQEFEVMEHFAHSLTDNKFRDQILECLSKRKPFRNFKELIHSSDYRQDWFNFKKNAYIDFVKEQINFKA